MDLKGGLKVNLTIWDTGVSFYNPTVVILFFLSLTCIAGQEKFHSLTGSYYRGAHGIFIVYDVSRRESFDHVQNWIKEIENNSTGDCIRFLIGNKVGFLFFKPFFLLFFCLSYFGSLLSEAFLCCSCLFFLLQKLLSQFFQIDLERKVETEEGKNLAKTNGMLFSEWYEKKNKQKFKKKEKRKKKIP